MAALAHVVVVVESHLTGGSWYTVSAAAARGVTVAAVPGSVRSPASAGSNRLLVEGAVPVRDVDDVLTAVELALAGRPDIVRPASSTPMRSPRRAGAPHRVISPAARRVRRVLDHDPAPIDVVVRRAGLALGDVALALEQLAEAGLAVAAQGFWSRPR
jgi:DNA processing protein